MAQQLVPEKRPFWSGVTWFRVSGNSRRVPQPPQPFGLLVEEVAKQSPAEAIGLRPSRVVAKIEGKGRAVEGDIVLVAMDVPLDNEATSTSCGSPRHSSALAMR